MTKVQFYGLEKTNPNEPKLIPLGQSGKLLLASVWRIEYQVSRIENKKGLIIAPGDGIIKPKEEEERVILFNLKGAEFSYRLQ